mgnify:CR=1 FL=1
MSLSSKPFSIIYNLISRGSKTVLCDFSHYTGNFQQITIKILEFVKKGRKGKIIYDNNSIFYYEEKSDIIYITLVKGDFDKIKDEHFFSFLLDIENSFNERYSLREIFQSYAYQLKDFSRQIQPIVNFYEDKLDYIKPGCLNNNENQKVEILRENIDDIIKNQNATNTWTPVELTVNNIQPDVKVESNSEEKTDMEMSVKFMRFKEKKERKRINKYIFLAIIIILITIIIIFVI